MITTLAIGFPLGIWLTWRYHPYRKFVFTVWFGMIVGSNMLVLAAGHGPMLRGYLAGMTISGVMSWLIHRGPPAARAVVNAWHAGKAVVKAVRARRKALRARRKGRARKPVPVPA